MEDDIKGWTAERKAALVLDIMQGKTTVAEAAEYPSRFTTTSVRVRRWV